jgi:hypothetical protein
MQPIMPSIKFTSNFMKTGLRKLLAALPVVTVATALFAAQPHGSAQEAATLPAPTGLEYARTYPFSMVGQIIFDSGDSTFQGSGTVVFGRSVLTAAHNLWDPKAGWSTDVEFRRSLYDQSSLGDQFAFRLFIMAGYAQEVRRLGADSERAFNLDMGGIRFPRALARGSYAGWRSDTRLLTGDVYNVALGYGGETHSGDQLLFAEPSYAFYPLLGGYFGNDSIGFEAGMSGGPVFAEYRKDDYRVVGIIVSGSTDPVSGGVRAINYWTALFINTYLRF